MNKHLMAVSFCPVVEPSMAVNFCPVGQHSLAVDRLLLSLSHGRHFCVTG